MSIIDLKQPKYSVTLPVSKEKVEFRPFTVKEEKILLLAQEDNNVDSMVASVGQIISNCTFGKKNIDNINKIDAEFLFVKIRNKSMGEGVNIRAICKECKEKTPMTLNLEDVKVDDVVVNNSINLVDDIWVTLRYPTIREAMQLDEKDGVTAIAIALESVIEGDNVKNASDYTMEERIEFVESLTTSQLIEFKKFFDAFPKMYLDLNYTCKCGHENNIHIEGIENFFG